MALKHYFQLPDMVGEIEANDAPYAVGDRVKLDGGPTKPDIWVRITGKRCITNDVKSANVHWDAERD
jgi:hypothetical protein